MDLQTYPLGPNMADHILCRQFLAGHITAGQLAEALHFLNDGQKSINAYQVYSILSYFRPDRKAQLKALLAQVGRLHNRPR